MRVRSGFGIVRILLAGAMIGALAAGTLAVSRGSHHRIYHAVLYSIVAERVTRGASSPDHAVRRLQEFVYQNVRTPRGAAILDGSPADTLVPGFGYCDPAVMVFLRLLEQINIPGRMIFLRRDDGVSPHTVSEVFLDGEWRVFDVHYGFVPRRPDGKVATINDLTAQPMLLTLSRTRPEWYRNARAFTLERRRSGLIRSMVRGLLTLTPEWLVDRFQDLYLLLPPPRYITTDGKLFEDYSASDSRLFFRARNYHVFLRTLQAESAYEELLRRYPESRYVDDSLYDLGLLALTQRQDHTSALARFRALLTAFPTTAWADEAAYFQARAYERAGDCDSAATLYRAVVARGRNGLEDARARLARFRCP